jgi:hypothetical protein
MATITQVPLPQSTTPPGKGSPMSVTRLVRRFALTLTLMLGVLLASAAAAGAAPGDPAPYPPPAPPGVQAPTTQPVAGAPISLVIGGFQPNEIATIILFSDPINLGTFQADGGGTVYATVTLPDGVAGPHTIQVTGNKGSSYSLGITVQSPSGLAFTGEGQGTGNTDDGGALAFTGVMVGGSILIALGLIAAGSLLLVGGKRKSNTPAS